MLFLLFAAAAAQLVFSHSCPGYSATNVKTTFNGLTADLNLAGESCNTYGIDILELTLKVEYQTDSRLHVIIQDANSTVYQVPESIFARPSASELFAAPDSQLLFSYIANPFGFAVSRLNGETLFNTSGSPLIFQSQYLGLRTSLPKNPNLYGLGEHSDPFRLKSTDYTRTLWARDAFQIPSGTNLYGSQPLYFDHRGENGTHGVMFLNSNGMDIKINNTKEDGQYLEYNTLGGVFDFYFVAGPTPLDVSIQVAEMVGLPAMMPYWAFGFQNCRFGYKSIGHVAEVATNYSKAGIPLETMWTDIDYMDNHKDFSLDPENFPLDQVREFIDYLHAHQQHYVVVVDPAVAYQNYPSFNNGLELDVFLKYDNGTLYQGMVWPGRVAFPDWFHPHTQAYWNNEFRKFFDPEIGVDIDGLWIDMNEAANFCTYPCKSPVEDFLALLSPVGGSYREVLKKNPTNSQSSTDLHKAKGGEFPVGSMMGLSNRELLHPPYTIQNEVGDLSDFTILTDIAHVNGLVEYDTHNLFGLMTSRASRQAMIFRKPTLRPMLIVRSNFLGAGKYVGHWLGDNGSTWEKYRVTISGMLQFASLFQIPMVGSDVCGFTKDTNEILCQRWAMLGAFQPFYRNHNGDDSIPQEFYLWPSVTESALYAIEIRYKMIDYIYTALHTQTVTGLPMISPMWFFYPNDTEAARVEFQFFYGNGVLVSPVTEEDSTSVDIYLPDDIFYDYNDGFAPVRGNGSVVTLTDVNFTTIPLHIRGGTIIPLRKESANTTTELRKKGFSVIVAPGLDESASGSLYLDEGTLLDQPFTTEIGFSFSNGTFKMRGSFAYSADVNIETITILGCEQSPVSVQLEGASGPEFMYNTEKKVLTISATIPLRANISMIISNARATITAEELVIPLRKVVLMRSSQSSLLWAISGVVVVALALQWLSRKHESAADGYTQPPRTELAFRHANALEAKRLEKAQ